MVPGGTTEIVWHFAGYLHLATEETRARLEYEEGALKLRHDDYVAKLPDYDAPADLDNPGYRGIRPPELIPDSPAFIGRHLPLKAAEKFPDHHVKAPSSDEIGKLVNPPPGGGIGVPHRLIHVNYSEGGDQRQLEINQLNMSGDDDLFGVAPDTNLQAFHPIDVGATLQGMTAAANALVPGDVALPQGGTAEVAQFVAARDATIAAGEGGDNAHSVAPGLYINGELQDEGVTRPEPPVVEEPPENLEAKGQWAELGGNIAVNAALIVDLNEAAPTLIVLGDYFKTNAIVQTNSLVDNDRVDIASPLSDDLVTGENKADNIAEFIQNAGVHQVIPGNFAGWAWNVQVVEGDFYDIRLLTQKNYLQDNDITLQDANETHYQVVAGENEQYNLTKLHDLFGHYDVIVIGGNYHGGNFIFQNNVILDNDVLKVVWDGEGSPAQAIGAGQNALLNDAQIISYGNDAFLPVGAGLDAFVDALASRQGSLDPSYGLLVPGDGTGVLDVLYITGDYYDINALWQVNVIADLDTAMQLLTPAKDGAALTQSASTGGNELTNQAIIVDVGSTAAFVGGEAYEDAILVQANIVTEDDDAVAIKDTDALVSEVIAFTDVPEAGEDSDMPPSQSTHVQDDVMGGVLT